MFALLGAGAAAPVLKPCRRRARRWRRDSAHEIKVLARDAAAHRAMLIVGRFFTGRRARQRTACLGISGLAHLSSDNIASRDRLIASAAYCRVCYSTVLASIASPGANDLVLQVSELSAGAAERVAALLSLGQTRSRTAPAGRWLLKKCGRAMQF